MKYCSKEDTRIEGPWEVGEKPNKQGGDRKSLKYLGELSEEDKLDLTPNTYIALYKAECLQDLKNSPYNHSDVRGVWLWGEPGCGKSH